MLERKLTRNLPGILDSFYLKNDFRYEGTDIRSTKDGKEHQKNRLRAKNAHLAATI